MGGDSDSARVPNIDTGQCVVKWSPRQLEGEPWSNPIDAEERTVTAGYAEWVASYDSPGNPVLLGEEHGVRELVARVTQLA